MSKGDNNGPPQQPEDDLNSISATVGNVKKRKDAPSQETPREKSKRQPLNKTLPDRSKEANLNSRALIPESTKQFLQNAVSGLPNAKSTSSRAIAETIAQHENEQVSQTLPLHVKPLKAKRKARVSSNKKRRTHLSAHMQLAYQAIAETHEGKLVAKEKLLQARQTLEEAEKVYNAAQSADKTMNDMHGPLILQDDGDEWNMCYQQLKIYKEQNGSESEPSEDCNVQEMLLMKWINKQRTLYRTGELESYKVVALEKINFMWSKKDVNVSHLLAFKQKFGHTRVPTHYKENNTLGNWVRKIRGYHRNGTLKEMVSKELVDRLNAIGFTWDLHEDHFNTMFEKLMQYKKIQGHCHVDKDDTDNPELVKFVREMRAAYIRFQKPRRKLTRDILTEERIKRLEAEGFQWNHDGVKWYQKYLALVRFQKKFGSCSVPRSFDLELYNFVNIQRRDYRLRLEYKNKGISDKRMKLLSEIGFIFVVQSGKGRPIKKMLNEETHQINHEMN